VGILEAVPYGSLFLFPLLLCLSLRYNSQFQHTESPARENLHESVYMNTIKILEAVEIMLMRIYLLMRVPTYSRMIGFSISYNLDGDFNLSCDLGFIFFIRSLINLPYKYPSIYTCTAEE
jgi:hypothetical protein